MAQDHFWIPPDPKTKEVKAARSAALSFPYCMTLERDTPTAPASPFIDTFLLHEQSIRAEISWFSGCWLETVFLFLLSLKSKLKLTCMSKRAAIKPNAPSLFATEIDCPPREIGKILTLFSICVVYGTNGLRWPQMGSGGFFPINPDIADILGRTDLKLVG